MTHSNFGHFRVALALLAATASACGVATAAAPLAARTYLPEDFARYAPRSALDMLEQVPGFVIREAAVERGLGQATGNVLVNGQRLSGKSNDVLAQLSRIPAGHVVRLEVVDGATLEIPGLSGAVANVVAKAEGISGSWRWQPDVRRYFTDPQLTRGEVSMSGTRGRLDYTMGFDNRANHSGAGGATTVYAADGSVRELRDESWTGETYRPRLTAQVVRHSADGSVLHFNAAWERVFHEYVEDGTRDAPGQPLRLRSVRSEEGGHHHEVGGDYEFPLASGRLKLIALDRYVHTPRTDTVETRSAEGAIHDGQRFRRDGRETERIARSEYRWQAGGDWQVSLEYAFNRLDSVSSLLARGADGPYVEEPLEGSIARVEEDRYELMATHGRALTPSVMLQASVGAEHSRLTHGLTDSLSRTFLRPKGYVSVAYHPRPGLDFNAKLQRRVGQLDFYDVLASVNLNDGQANAGNPDLVPPQTWEIELEASRELGAYGRASMRLYHQRIDDIVDTIPIGAAGESPGNIDTAKVTGIEWKGTLALDPLGWSGAKLNAHAQSQTSRVRDPLTGAPRPISNHLKDLAELGLRHDVPGTRSRTVVGRPGLGCR